jgi:hypothetical protein
MRSHSILTKLTGTAAAIGFFALSSISAIAQQAPTKDVIDFKSRIIDQKGIAIPDGTYNMKFMLFDASSGGNQLWTEERGVQTRRGTFNVDLGGVVPFPKEVLGNVNSLFLHICLDFNGQNSDGTGICAPRYEEDFQIRKRITSVPWALRAFTLGPQTITSGQTAFDINTFGDAGNLARFNFNGANRWAMDSTGTVSMTDGTNIVSINPGLGKMFLPSGGDLLFGALSLRGTTGAALIGVDPTNFTNISGTNVQQVLDSIDDHIGTGGGGGGPEVDPFWTASRDTNATTVAPSWSFSSTMNTADVIPSTDATSKLGSGTNRFKSANLSTSLDVGAITNFVAGRDTVMVDDSNTIPVGTDANLVHLIDKYDTTGGNPATTINNGIFNEQTYQGSGDIIVGRGSRNLVTNNSTGNVHRLFGASNVVNNNGTVSDFLEGITGVTTNHGTAGQQIGSESDTFNYGTSGAMYSVVSNAVNEPGATTGSITNFLGYADNHGTNSDRNGPLFFNYQNETDGILNGADSRFSETMFSNHGSMPQWYGISNEQSNYGTAGGYNMNWNTFYNGTTGTMGGVNGALIGIGNDGAVSGDFVTLNLANTFGDTAGNVIGLVNSLSSGVLTNPANIYGQQNNITEDSPFQHVHTVGNIYDIYNKISGDVNADGDIYGIYNQATSTGTYANLYGLYSTEGTTQAYLNYNGQYGVYTPNAGKFNDGVIVGNSAVTEAGKIRYNGSDFEGWDGSSWLSFTSGTGAETDPQFTDAKNTTPTTITPAWTFSDGAIFGNSSNDAAGKIRFTGSDFEGFNGSSWLSLTSGGGGGTPAGNNGNIQFNNSGAFGGNDNFSWDNANNNLTVNVGDTVDKGITIVGNPVSAYGDMGLKIENTAPGGKNWYFDATSDNSGYGAGKLILRDPNLGNTYFNFERDANDVPHFVIGPNSPVPEAALSVNRPAYYASGGNGISNYVYGGGSPSAQGIGSTVNVYDMPISFGINNVVLAQSNSDTIYGFHNIATLNTDTNDADAVTGIYNVSEHAGNSNIGTITGIYNQYGFGGGGTAGGTTGIHSLFIAGGGPTGDNYNIKSESTYEDSVSNNDFGFDSKLGLSYNADLQNYYGYYAETPSDDGSGAQVHNLYGAYIKNQNHGVDSNYGLYIEGASGGSINNYSLLVASGVSQFQTHVNIGDSASISPQDMLSLDTTDGSGHLSGNFYPEHLNTNYAPYGTSGTEAFNNIYMQSTLDNGDGSDISRFRGIRNEMTNNNTGSVAGIFGISSTTTNNGPVNGNDFGTSFQVTNNNDITGGSFLEGHNTAVTNNGSVINMRAFEASVLNTDTTTSMIGTHDVLENQASAADMAAIYSTSRNDGGATTGSILGINSGVVNDGTASGRNANFEFNDLNNGTYTGVDTSFINFIYDNSSSGNIPQFYGTQIGANNDGVANGGFNNIWSHLTNSSTGSIASGANVIASLLNNEGVINGDVNGVYLENQFGQITGGNFYGIKNMVGDVGSGGVNHNADNIYGGYTEIFGSGGESVSSNDNIFGQMIKIQGNVSATNSISGLNVVMTDPLSYGSNKAGIVVADVNSTTYIGFNDTYGVYTGGYSVFNGGINVGDGGSSNDGDVRYTGSDFEGFFGGSWHSFTSGGGSSQWQDQTPNIYFNTGNVGIGTDSPVHVLDVVGDARVYGPFTMDGPPGTGYATFNDMIEVGSSSPNTSQSDVEIQQNQDEFGNIRAHLKLLPNLLSNPTTLENGMLWYNGSQLDFYNGSTTTDLLASGSSQWTDSGANIYFNSGNVGIGTTTPAEPLHVEGNTLFNAGTFSWDSRVFWDEGDQMYFGTGANPLDSSFSGNVRIEPGYTFSIQNDDIFFNNTGEMFFGQTNAGKAHFYGEVRLESNQLTMAGGGIQIDSGFGIQIDNGDILQQVGNINVTNGYVCVDDGSTTCPMGGGVAGTVYAQFAFSEFDFAENINGNKNLENGDIVVPDLQNEETVTKSNASYQNNILGVISTDPGVTGGVNMKAKDGQKIVPLALSGRVPVKVSLENGPIKIGDAITSSSTAGLGMKATQSGRIIGFALQNYDGNQTGSKIVVQLNPGFNQVASAALNETGAKISSDILENILHSGKAILAAGKTEATIKVASVKSTSIVTLTPTSSTQGQVPFISQVGDGYFTIKIDYTVGSTISFNFLVR